MYPKCVSPSRSPRPITLSSSTLELVDVARECFLEVAVGAGNGEDGVLTCLTLCSELDDPRLCLLARPNAGLMRALLMPMFTLRPLPTEDMDGDLLWWCLPIALLVKLSVKLRLVPLLTRRLIAVEGDPLRSICIEMLDRREWIDEERRDLVADMAGAADCRILCVELPLSRLL